MDAATPKSTLWLRAETKALEARTAISPEQARALLSHGIRVVVERSDQRAIPDSAYQSQGCELVSPGSWIDAGGDIYVLGVKDLPDKPDFLSHSHIYFGHAYKQQTGWQALLRRFKRGGGTLLDIEYLVDENGRRVAAFGYWAGFTGCAVALMAWAGQQLEKDPPLADLRPYQSRQALISALSTALDEAINVAHRHPDIMIIGANGRVGAGARDLARELGLAMTLWDIDETAGGGPFEECLAHDVLVNCVLVTNKIPPFVTLDTLASPGRRLSVISDVSCDPGEFNPIPVYSHATTFLKPTHRVMASPVLDLTAIDHLPSLLPVEATENFGSQLLPHLLQLGTPLQGVWQRAAATFQEKIQDL